MVLLVDAIDGTPQVRERYRYSPYGVPWGMSRGDFNGDGATDDGDFGPFGDAYDNVNGSVGNAWRFDMNLDGSVDDGDFSIFGLEYDRYTGIGYGKQSRDDVVNEFGYAGYAWDHAAGMNHVRNRVYSPLLGRWTKRDPANDIDGFNIYTYGRGNHLFGADPTGLKRYLLGFEGFWGCSGDDPA